MPRAVAYPLMPACRNCDRPIEPFIDFGRMPLANGFLTAAQLAGEYFFRLQAAYCPHCWLVQLVDQPPRELMFNERYPFFSATSSRMRAHFADLAREAMTLAPRDAFVVEIGSNDGTLLRHVAQAGIRHLGFEPSASVAAAARDAGVNTACEFFDVAAARRIAAEHGHAHVIIGANALSHVGRPHDVAGGIAQLLAPDGVCIIEEPYWGDVVASTAFDQIYDEHACYFSLTSLSHLFGGHGLVVADVSHVDVHGGSLRYRIATRGTPSRRVASLLAQEQATALCDPGTFDAFRDRVAARGAELLRRLDHYRRAGRRVVGYGATSKSTTPINYFGISQDQIEFICDTTPAKHNTLSPGAHIPVRPHSAFVEAYPDRALLFLWNHAAEVREKERVFERGGGKWLVYVPDVREL